MPLHDELCARMKDFYEQVPKTKLMRRTPVAIRVDGKWTCMYAWNICFPEEPGNKSCILTRSKCCPE